MLDPYSPIKTHLAKNLCYHVYQFPKADTGCVLSKKIGKFHAKKPVLGSLFIKFWLKGPVTLFKKILQRKCFLVKFSRILRTLILKNICERVKANLASSASFRYKRKAKKTQCGCSLSIS